MSFDDRKSLIISILKRINEYKKNLTQECEEEEEEIEESEENILKLRQQLKSTLTVLGYDLDDSLCDDIEKLLLEERNERKIIDCRELVNKTSSLCFCVENIHDTQKVAKVLIWQGDITTLQIDAIVNAANKWLLGCFTPNHACIDNVIHSWSGPRLRAECRTIVNNIGGKETTGEAKITKGYALPSKYVLHTVGPIVKSKAFGVRGEPTPKQEQQLASCYIKCLEVAAKHGDVSSIAFCCISTGVFGYPQDMAATVAMQTVRSWLAETEDCGLIDLVIFNVFTDKDFELYEQLAPTIFGIPQNN